MKRGIPGWSHERGDAGADRKSTAATHAAAIMIGGKAVALLQP
jgi:hypothetical protein